MRTPPPALLPLLRSRLQGDLLALLFLHPDQEYSLSEAATAISASVKAIQQEATRLVTAGLIADRRRGNLRLLRAVSDSLLSRPLTDLLALTYGPLPVLSDALAGVAKVKEAYIYGSWAARYQGEPGPIPADVDVLVVGTASMDDLEDAAAKAQEQLRRPVNIRRVRPAAWHDPQPSDSFLASIRSRPLVDLRRRGEEQRS